MSEEKGPYLAVCRRDNIWCVDDYYTSEEEARKAAALFNAAPDLLEACQRMLFLAEIGSIGNKDGEPLKTLQAAIAKAIGN